MKVHKEPDKEQYKIKVNKKGPNNDYNNSQNYFNNLQEKRHKTYKSNIIPNHLSFSNNNNNQGKISYMNIYNPTTGLKKHKNNSNSVEKYPSIKSFGKEDEINENIFIRDKKYSKSILNSQNIDENLLNFEPIKTIDDNLSIRRNIYNNKKPPKYDYNKRHNLFIKTNDFNNSNNNDVIIKRNYRTIEHNNVNNYINEYQLTNNYYEYEYDVNNKNINFKNYNRNAIPYDSERKKNNEYSNISINPFLYCSYEKNVNSFSNKNEEFQTNIQEIDNNFNNNFDYDNNNFNIPEVYIMNNNINPEKYSNDNSDKYSNYKIRRSIYNNKDINENNNLNFNSINNSIRERRKYKNISIKSKSKYNDIRYILQNDFTNYNSDKDGYNKKLFNIYRAKLMQEFLRHIIYVINNHLSKYFKLFIYSIHFLNINTVGDGAVMPKIYLNKTHRISEAKISNYLEANDDNEDKDNYMENDMQNSPNIKNKKYIQIFFSDKKYSPKPELHKFLTSRNTNELLKLHGKTENRIANVNEYSIISNQRNPRMLNNTRLFKYIDKFHNINKTISENSTIRNSLKLNRDKSNKKDNNLSHNLINSNNINQVLDINNSLNNYIYKKKIKLSKNNTFITRVNKKESNDTNTKNNVSNKNKTYNSSTLSNAKGKKIIDIDINLGKPVKDISDISPLQSFFINDYDNKKFKSSLSVNKNDKTRKKNKNKKKLLLPKKKYLEEGYDFISPIKNDENKFKISEFRTNSYDDKKTKFKNLLTQNNSIITTNANGINYFNTISNNNNIKDNNNNEKKYFKNILVKNIVTSDKRLFIHINYIFSHKSNNIKKKYDIKALKIKRNKSLFIQPNKNLIIHKYKSMSNNSFFTTKNLRKDLDTEKTNNKNNKKNPMENQKDKYLFSCIKFFVKTINRIFLKKLYAQYKKGIENKNNTIQKMENNKIRTYKRRINKGANI